MTTIEPRRPWYALDLPKVLVFCLFVMTVEGIAAIVYYRDQVALIPELGRAMPKEVIETAELTNPTEPETRTEMSR